MQTKYITALLLLLAFGVCQAQTNNQNVGLPPNATFQGSSVESVQVNNGNLHIEIPLFTLPGRGLPVQVSYVYDSKGWYPYTPSLDTYTYVNPAKNMLDGKTSQQWRISAPLANRYGYTVKLSSGNICGPGPNQNASWNLQEGNGTSHPFPTITYGYCGQNYSGNLIYATDGSGFALQLDANNSVVKAISKDGSFTYLNSAHTLDVLEDSNGNQITRLPGSSNITDTLGRTVNLEPVLNTGTGKYELAYNDSSGTQQKIIITKSPVTVTTHLCGSTKSLNGCVEYSPHTWQMPTEIDLPNGMKYVITYDQNSYGTPSSLTLPTGAVVNYTYGTIPHNGCTSGALFSVDDSGPRVTSRSIVNGAQTSTWQYSYTCEGTLNDTTTVTDPSGNDTVRTMVHFADSFSLTGSLPPSYETQASYYSGPQSGNNLLKTVVTDYLTKDLGPHLPIRETTTWNAQGGLTSKTETDYDTIPNPVSSIPGDADFARISWNNVMVKREFAFGVGSPGALARRTDFYYLHLVGNTNYTSYVALNMANRMTAKTTYDGTGTKVADATSAYDTAALTTTSGVPSHDYTVGTFRGNPTQSNSWLNTTGTWLTTNNTFSDLGNMMTTQDPGGHTTAFNYGDTWSGTPCRPAANSQAYLTQTTAPDTVNQQGTTVHHRSRATYFPCTGLKQSTRDENDVLAARIGTQYTYDLMNRPLTITRPDGGQTSYGYVDTPNAVSITTTQSIDASNDLVTVSLRDGLGREKQSQITSDPEGTVKVDTTYDLLGRKATVNNPYRSTSDSTYGNTTYNYDALDRVTKEIPPDGTTSSNNVVTSYGGQAAGLLGLSTTVTDQAGKKRKTVTDALGRLVDAWEPDSGGNFTYETAYQYDALDNLARIDQKGNDANSANWRTRTFTYDSLSHLLTANNPESGQITWTYDSDSNVVTKKDARNITITYSYDQLHRTIGKSYSNGDPAVSYFYDQSSYNGLTITERANQRTGMSDGSGQTAWSFNIGGRAVTEKRKIDISGLTPVGGVTKTINYAYNLDGSLASLTYPSGKTVTYTYSDAARPVSAIDTANSLNYVKNATYAPHGSVNGLVNAFTTTFAGLITSNGYNKRLQPVFLTATAPSQTLLSLGYDWHLGVNDNGTIAKITNNRDTTRSQNFTYDQLNRIATAYTDGSVWGNDFQIDIWGNLTGKTVHSGKPQGESFTASASAKNRLNTYSYDASGNLLNDQLGHAFSYDAENRPYSAAGISYTYDGDGERVAKSNGKLYFFGTAPAPVAETSASGAITAEYIFFNGKRTARLLPDGTVHYYFSDHLGSANILTNNTGTIKEESDFYPYGGERIITDTLANTYKFTGKERDTETNNDYFGARYYSSTFGRFLTPDWSATPEAVPYGVIGNPQTFNLYGYVQNNPITGTDPDGHCPVLCTAAIGGAIGAVAVIGAEVWHGEPVFTKESGFRIVGGFTGGAIIGGSMGVASEAGLPLILEAIAGGSGGVAGGVADRAISSGSLEGASHSLDNPLDPVKDFGGGMLGVGLEKGVAHAVESLGSAELSQANKELARKGSVKGKAAAAKKVAAEEAKVGKKADRASQFIGAGQDFYEKLKQNKKEDTAIKEQDNYQKGTK